MNGTEQKNHRTAVKTLAVETAEAIEAMEKHIRDEAVRLSGLIGNERTHRLDLAKEQRAYVDGEIREVRRSMVASDDSLGHRLRTIESLTLWGRIRWFFSGRIESHTSDPA